MPVLKLTQEGGYKSIKEYEIIFSKELGKIIL